MCCDKYTCQIPIGKKVSQRRVLRSGDAAIDKYLHEKHQQLMAN